MRQATILSAVLALELLGCSHAAIDPSPEPAPSVVASAELPSGGAGATVTKTYRVPVDGLPSMGDASAPVTMVAFLDYQCPYCRRADAVVAQLRSSYGNQLRVVVAEKPLPMHEHARAAAVAALAAASQGAFEPMHARLMTGELDDASIRTAAKGLNLDLAQLESDRATAATALSQAEDLARRLHVTGTPTFFVNGKRLSGAQPIEQFRALIDEQLATARALVASGVRAQDVYARTIAGGLDYVDEASDDTGPGCAGAAGCNDPGGNGQGCVEGECNGADPKVDEAPTAVPVVENVPVDGNESRGKASAPITIVEFADYQCPFCVRAEATVHALEAAHPGQIRFVFKNMPLPFHENARLMARATVAASSQGRFWEMHDKLLSFTGTMNRAALDGIATGVGLNVTKFDRDLDDASLDARIDADVADAGKLGVKGTPTFFVNGRRIVGAQPQAAFEKVIASAANVH